jgi:hypothetical protein
MMNQGKKKGSVSRFFSLLVGTDREDATQRYDVALTRSLIEEMRAQCIDIASRRFAPVTYRVTIPEAEYAEQHMEQVVVRQHFQKYVSCELAHEISRETGSDITPDGITVTFDKTSLLERGNLQVEMRYGDLGEGDTGDVIGHPSLGAASLIELSTEALVKASVGVGSRSIAPRHVLVSLCHDDGRFWSQYPHIHDALLSELRVALAGRVANLEGDSEVTPDEFTVEFAASDAVNTGAAEVVASLDPIRTPGGATDSPLASDLTSEMIVAEFMKQLNAASIAIGTELLIPHYFLGHLGEADYRYWTHYPQFVRELTAHLKQTLAVVISDRLSGRTDQPLSPDAIKLGFKPDDTVPAGTIRVDASLDLLPIPDVKSEPSQEQPTPLTPATAGVPLPVDDASEVVVLDAVPDEAVTMKEPVPTPVVPIETEVVIATGTNIEMPTGPRVTMVLTGEDGVERNYPVSSLPAVVGRTGGSADDGIHVPLENAAVFSRSHFRLHEDGGLWITLSPKATNQTLLNDSVMMPGDAMRVKSGDEITVGALSLRFIVDGPAVSAQALRDAIAEVAGRCTIAVGDDQFALQRFTVGMDPESAAWWRDCTDIDGVSPEGGEILIEDADAFGVRAFWGDAEGREAIPGPPPVSIDAMKQAISGKTNEGSLTVKLAPDDHAWWTQSFDVVSALVAVLCGAGDCTVRLASDASVQPGEISVVVRQTVPSAQDAVVLSIRFAGVTATHRVDRLPAIVGRSGASVQTGDYAVQLENTPEISRKHFRVLLDGGALAVTVLAEATNDLIDWNGEAIERETPFVLALGKPLTVGVTTIMFDTPAPPFQSPGELRSMLAERAAVLPERPHGAILEVRMDPESHAHWTQYSQLGEAFVSMVASSVTAAQSPDDGLSTRIVSAGGTEQKPALVADDAIETGNVELAWVTRDFAGISWSMDTPVVDPAE